MGNKASKKAQTNEPRRAIVTNINMSDDMQQDATDRRVAMEAIDVAIRAIDVAMEAIDVAIRAIDVAKEKHNKDEDIALYIKKEFDKKFLLLKLSVRLSQQKSVMQEIRTHMAIGSSPKISK